MSDKVAADVGPLVAGIVPNGAAFDRRFDHFVHLMGLIYVDVTTGGLGNNGAICGQPVRRGIDETIDAEVTKSGVACVMTTHFAPVSPPHGWLYTNFAKGCSGVTKSIRNTESGPRGPLSRAVCWSRHSDLNRGPAVYECGRSPSAGGFT
jgi:hypothetical protein